MLTRDESLSAIIEGVHDANKKYLEISGGWCVQDSGVESLVSSRVAESLFNSGVKKDGKCFVTLETSYQSITDGTRVKKVGRTPLLLDRNQRADIVYWHKKDTPIGIVEIKRWFEYSGIEDDINRTARLVKDYGISCGGRLRWGAVASIRQLSERKRKDEKELLEDFLRKCRSSFSDLDFWGRSRIEEAEEGDKVDGFEGYCAFAVVFRPIRSN